MATTDPIASARVPTVMTRNPGVRTKVRHAFRRSFIQVCTRALSRKGSIGEAAPGRTASTAQRFARGPTSVRSKSVAKGLQPRSSRFMARCTGTERYAEVFTRDAWRPRLSSSRPRHECPAVERHVYTPENVVATPRLDVHLSEANRGGRSLDPMHFAPAYFSCALTKSCRSCMCQRQCDSGTLPA